ncbi:MAG: DUF4159 domain-containing protein [Planctomycetota bacterium]
MVFAVSGLAAVAQPHAPAAAEPTSDDVQAAMERMRSWLYAQQKEDGSWELSAERWSADMLSYRRLEGGETALVTYALLVSGEPYQKPEIARALAYLRGVEMHGIYALSFRMHVWAQLPMGEGQPFKALLDADGERLMSWQRVGLWDYTSAPREYARPVRVTPQLAMVARNSLSRTQYGALGAWEWSKRGGRVSKQLWQDLRAWGLAFQLAPGGWNYGRATSRSRTPADGGMTCAGLTLLMLSQHHLERNADEADGETVASIERGLAWLGGAYRGGPITGRDENWPGMFWYAIERVGQASGLTRLGGRDWYRDGARWYLQREAGGRVSAGQTRQGSSDLIETAFGLAFLARGDTPLWINKLEAPGYAWNRRPNDVYFLNRFVSDYHERELGWQVVSIDGRPERWLDAPLLYLSGREALELTEAQEAKLKRYLDLGGMLVAVPERGGRSFERSVRELAKRLYPELGAMRAAPKEHPIYGLTLPAGRGLRVSVLSNGVRDLIVLPRGDWGKGFQADDPPGEGDAWKAMLNLMALATERGRHRPRLAAPFPEDPGASTATSATVRVGIAVRPGSPAIEPLRFEALRRRLVRDRGIDLDVRFVPWGEPSTPQRGPRRERVEADPPWGGARPDVLVVSGVEAPEGQAARSEAELALVQSQVVAGGVVVIETIGGRGGHAAAASAALLASRGEAPRALVGTPWATGRGIDGGVAIARLTRRGQGALAAPSAEVFLEGDRPAILVSGLDLSLGAMGLRRAGVIGYAPETAAGLWTNVLLSSLEGRD